jgi:DNA modification methylase
MTYQVINGNNIEVLKTFPDNHFDSIVTDPPYGIDFLGKDWDANTGALETYQECLRVLKPGGHILAFSAARTYHHLAITLEQAGFEIRDQIMWIYSSGFPKSHDVGKQIDKKAGKGTFLKTGKTKVSGGPRDDLSGTFPRTDETIYIPETDIAKKWEGWGNALKPAHEPICMGRKPMKTSIIQNVQEWGTGAINIDATRIPYDADNIPTVGNRTSSFHNATGKLNETISGGDGSGGFEANESGRFPTNVLGEIEGYQKYFYCPKVSRKERGEYNTHPTVKPVELMKYLVNLVTPKGGTVLDPFNGSGSTGMACVELNYDYVGIDLDSNYVDISVKRIEAHSNKHKISELFVIE